jgi:hypothetical protein
MACILVDESEFTTIKTTFDEKIVILKDFLGVYINVLASLYAMQGGFKPIPVPFDGVVSELWYESLSGGGAVLLYKASVVSWNMENLRGGFEESFVDEVKEDANTIITSIDTFKDGLDAIINMMKEASQVLVIAQDADTWMNLPRVRPEMLENVPILKFLADYAYDVMNDEDNKEFTRERIMEIQFKVMSILKVSEPINAMLEALDAVHNIYGWTAEPGIIGYEQRLQQQRCSVGGAII